MALKWPYLLLALLVVGIVAFVAWTIVVRRRMHDREDTADSAFAAHVSRLRQLPRFKTLARRWVLVATAQVVGLMLIVVGASVAAARPTSTQTVTDSPRNRDIMLCLDASSSMSSSNVEVVEQMQAIVAQLKGERIGLSLFSSATVTIFPLTDDYGFVERELERARKAFEANDFEYGMGTTLVQTGRASQMSDGTASCVQRLVQARRGTDSKRGQAVIIASDNQPQGVGVYTLDEAAAVARKNDVLVYGVGANTMSNEEEDGFRQFIGRTGGKFWRLGDESATKGIVSGIAKLEAERVKRPPRIVVSERPQLGLVPVGLGLLIMAAAAAAGRVMQGSGRRG